jgi:hypothetical protein
METSLTPSILLRERSMAIAHAAQSIPEIRKVSFFVVCFSIFIP